MMYTVAFNDNQLRLIQMISQDSLLTYEPVFDSDALRRILDNASMGQLAESSDVEVLDRVIDFMIDNGLMVTPRYSFVEVFETEELRTFIKDALF